MLSGTARYDEILLQQSNQNGAVGVRLQLSLSQLAYRVTSSLTFIWLGNFLPYLQTKANSKLFNLLIAEPMQMYFYCS